MRVERALKLRDSAVRGVADAYRLARLVGLPSADINETVSAIRAELKPAPGWVRAYLDGYRRALDDALNAEPGAIVYGGFWKGRFVSVNSSRPDYYGKLGIEPSAFAGMSDKGEVESLGLYWGSFDPPRPWFLGEQPADIRKRLSRHEG